MRRPLHVPLFVLCGALGVCSASAGESSPILKDPAPVAETPFDRPAPPRAVSPQVAEKLAAAAPKYIQLPAPAKPSETSPELHETDKPRNGIIRLPRYVVQESKLPELKEREILTSYGRLDLALKRHPGLRFGSFGPFKNDFWANALLEEEFGIERQKELASLLSLLPGPAARPPIFSGRPPFATPAAASGPWNGLLVPWERR